MNAHAFFGTAAGRIAAVLFALHCAAAGASETVRVDVDFAADFTDPITIDNPYLPLPQGREMTYRAMTADGCLVRTMMVTAMTGSDLPPPYHRIIARIVEFSQRLDRDCDGTPEGDPLEVRRNWYAEDDFGHVWQFGSEVGRDGGGHGSWQAGSDIDGVGSVAEAGVVMLAHRDTARTESVVAAAGMFHAPGRYAYRAEDTAKVLRTDAVVRPSTAKEPGRGAYNDCLATKKWSVLRPGSTELEYYCPYVGLVLFEERGPGAALRYELMDVR